jgi:hypothetical protein
MPVVILRRTRSKTVQRECGEGPEGVQIIRALTRRACRGAALTQGLYLAAYEATQLELFRSQVLSPHPTGIGACSRLSDRFDVELCSGQPRTPRVDARVSGALLCRRCLFASLP